MGISTTITLITGFLYVRQLKTELRTLKTGSRFILLLVMSFITINLLFLLLRWDKVLITEAILGLILLFVGGIVLFILLIVESIKVWRLENHSLGNLLLPLSVIAFFLIGRLTNALVVLPEEYDWLKYFSVFYGLFLPFMIWNFVVFLVSSLIYAKQAPLQSKNKQYFVVLGAGLVNGDQVGKLLAARIEKAVRLAQAETIIIFSGGQGADEKQSEASAMRAYAVSELHFPEHRTLLEDKSRTTYENLVFSSALIQENPFSFFTSDYHVLRAAIFAKSLGLDAQGYGGKTALYYRIPAFIREFIAIVNAKKKTYAILIVLMLILPLIFLLLFAV
ncbi:hypothetical protein RU86_GL001048 [Lactococcus piscium]|uniref:DUF218 domain-containing protein n=1 Tax=Pseudolactococcus piscium TaxID=1364 RepID=A0A2A5S5C6_9LACT|nr:hypothetical protein RU86_GL001048 [Lactococcus piscium]